MGTLLLPFQIFPITEICRAIFRTKTSTCRHFAGASIQKQLLDKVQTFPLQKPCNIDYYRPQARPEHQGGPHI
jgi:predicted Abi (CAAX) family protease